MSTPHSDRRGHKAWLQEALEHADELDVGSGHGPVHHFHGVWERGLDAPTGSHVLKQG